MGRPRWAFDDRGEANARCSPSWSRTGRSLDDKDLRADVASASPPPASRGARPRRRPEPFAAAVADLDADPHLLNVANGTLDLHTLGLRPHCPADRITKVCRGAYGPVLRCRLGGLPGPVLPDDEVRRFLQRLVGVACWARCSSTCWVSSPEPEPTESGVRQDDPVRAG